MEFTFTSIMICPVLLGHTEFSKLRTLPRLAHAFFKGLLALFIVILIQCNIENAKFR